MNEAPTEETQKGAEEQDVRHEAHPHARHRLVWGIAAVLLVAAGVVVWAQWGEEIKEACLGEAEACVVELADVPEDGAEFDTPTAFEGEL